MGTSKPSRRRRKSDDEDEIDLSYYANSPTLQGMLSHLKPELRDIATGVASSAEVPVSVTTSHDDPAQAETASDEWPDVVTSHDVASAEGSIGAKETVPELTIPHDDSPETASRDVTDGAVTTYEDTAGGEIVPNLGRRRVLYVGHSTASAHSALENQFYNWAWRHAAPVDDDRRCLRGSPAKIGVIAREMNITERSTIELLKRMVDKLALDICPGWIHGKQEGKSYFIHSLRKILERRRQAGLEYAIKGKGVILISEEQAK